MKTISTLLLFYFLTFTNAIAQVGIGTTNPTKDLDINGELRVRSLPTLPSDATPIASDTDGNFGISTSFFPSDVGTVVATTNVDFSTNGGFITNDAIDLGLSISVNIPANKEALVIITYSLPVGMSSFTSPAGYYGARFLRNGVEEQSGSRKFTVNSNASANMVTVSATYTETFTSSPTDTNINYTLNGYVEQLGSPSGFDTYRFNMWQPNGDNFNWGRATITKQVFIR